MPFQLDHIIARKHGGTGELENFCWSCSRCNANKGPCVAGLAPKTGELCRLFHPRLDRWSDHFIWNGPILIGLTDIGETTIYVLAINHPDAIAVRAALIEEAVFPPTILSRQ